MISDSRENRDGRKYYGRADTENFGVCAGKYHRFDNSVLS